MIRDYFSFGISNLKKRKMRTWLTMLGIFIGIAAVVSLVGLGQGIQKSVNEQFEKLGVYKLIISPKGTFSGIGSTGNIKLTKKDIDTIRKVPGIDEVSGMLIATGKIEFNNRVRYLMVSGIPTDKDRKLIEEMQSYEIASGRDLKTNEKNKVVLGRLFKEGNIFNPNLKLGDKIKINDVEFKIIGFFAPFGNTEDDKNIRIPEDIMREVFDLKDEYSIIMAQASQGLDPEIAAERVEKELRNKRNIEENKEDFTIQTSRELMESFQVILNIIQIFLIGIAAISLVVGGIGIMNTMYTSVLERTKEIGIMKSIGAKNLDILIIFLIESGILGLIGGLIGIILGIGFSKLIELGAKLAGYGMIQVSFPLYLILGTLLFSFLIGAISGVLPARQASKLKPVQALRYE